MKSTRLLLFFLLAISPLFSFSQEKKSKPNVLLIISDDLTTTALGTYGNRITQTPHIDQLAREGVQFDRAYSQFPVCGPSRASFMFGYYPSATETYGYVSGREQVGTDRLSLAQWFKNQGYYTARVSKIYHMGIPGDIEKGADGTDDAASWTEKFNVKAPEWQAPGKAELVQNNPDGSIVRKGGNVMTIVQASDSELDHADGMAAEKAAELIRAHKKDPFFLAVGLVRPHVPFVAPEKYFIPYPWQQMVPPPVVQDDWADIPARGINYVTTKNGQMSYAQKQKAIAAYYASVSFMDAQVGKLLQTLKEEGLEENTIVVFVSDHGFHLGEHDFWMKVSLHEESVQVPFLIKAPGVKSGSSSSFAELLDLYPTLVDLVGGKIPRNLQGKSLVPVLKDKQAQVRDMAFSVSQNGNTYLVRTDRWAYIQYDEDAKSGMELYDMYQDPKQYSNLAQLPEYANVVAEMQKRLREKLTEVRKNDLNKTYLTEK
ncbi:sulfatase [Algoriphagus aestuariicola]|uniref:Sulfatase n=1 Tax=Algoriphagus aestuariicola TaxID=1852016 RepID=A0ABS3BSY0_9BACT|nr:sulfatase [Algoriphagus aestuariicola]MBN7802223.1 sulfatase [Algoriphagus aestuariicola]